MRDGGLGDPRSAVLDHNTGVLVSAVADDRDRNLVLRERVPEDPGCGRIHIYDLEGDLFFGTTIIYPGKVGAEYHLTRGHYHRKRHHAETYQALSGSGLVLFERQEGQTERAELKPGGVTYIPPFWAHRSVNTSPVPLVFLWTCAVDAGHDYESIAGRGMSQVVVERNGMPHVENRPFAPA